MTPLVASGHASFPSMASVIALHGPVDAHRPRRDPRPGTRRSRDSARHGQGFHGRRHGVCQRHPQQPGLRVPSRIGDRRERPVRLPEHPPQSVPPRDRRAGLPVGRARRGREWIGADRVDPHHGGRRHEHGRGGGRPRRGSARARPDRAHRHRPDARRPTPARKHIGVESGRHAGVAGRGRRRQRLLSPDRRSRPDAVLHRQPARDRPAEPHLLQPDLARRRAVDGSDHRSSARRVRRQGQPGGPHRHQVGPGPEASERIADGQLRNVQHPGDGSQLRSRDRTRSATSSR